MPPIGWYYAQGLIPLGYDSSDDDEGPCELPNGRLVCGPHGLAVCGRCCVDYSFMDDLSDEDAEDEDEDEDDGDDDDGDDDDGDDQDEDDQDEDEDEKGEPMVIIVPTPSPGDRSAIRRGTGRAFPTKFIPPSSTILPSQLFPGRRTYAKLSRYIHRDDPRKVLFFTDGACLNNGQPNPKAGWAVIHGPGRSGGPALVASCRLDEEGPFGDPGIQSSNRAELRAVIAALRLRHWPGEGFHTVVIATDSAYVTDGSTEWARNWMRNGWQTAGGRDVQNRDLWEALLGEVERWNDAGLAVQFWKIPRDWNEVADAAAKKAAALAEAPDIFVDVMGICF